jgi:hypothetical protein
MLGSGFIRSVAADMSGWIDFTLNPPPYVGGYIAWKLMRPLLSMFAVDGTNEAKQVLKAWQLGEWKKLSSSPCYTTVRRETCVPGEL